MRRLKGFFRESGLRGQLLRGGAAGFAVRVLSVLSGLLASIVLARNLGPAEYGIYTFILAIIMTIALPVQLGLPTLVVRETAQARANKDWPLMRGLWVWASRAIVISTTSIILLVALWLWIGSTMEPSRKATLIYGMAMVPLLAFAAVRGAALRGLKRVFIGIFPDQVLRPLLLASFVGLLGLTATVTATTAMLLFVTASTIALIVGFYALWRIKPKELLQTSAVRFKGAKWCKSLVPLTLIVGFNVVSHNTDLIMLGFLRSDEDVGFYRIAMSISTLAIFGLSVMNLFIQPYFAEASTKGDKGKLQKLASISSIAAICFTIPTAFLLWILGEWLIRILYGIEYAPAYAPLLILMIGQTVSAFFGSVGNVLTMSGNEGQNLRVLAISAAVNIGLNMLLIPSLGTVGAAIATSTSIALTNVLFWRSAMRTVGINSSPFGYFSMRNRF